MPAFGKAKATALADAAADSDGRKKAKARARAKFGELDTLNVAIGIRKSLDALVNSLFKGNAAASHVERQGTRKAKPATGATTSAPKVNP